MITMNKLIQNLNKLEYYKGFLLAIFDTENLLLSSVSICLTSMVCKRKGYTKADNNRITTDHRRIVGQVIINTFCSVYGKSYKRINTSLQILFFCLIDRYNILFAFGEQSSIMH